MAQFNGGYSPAGAGLSKMGELLLGFLMQKMQSDTQKGQFNSQQDLQKKQMEMAAQMQKFQMAQTAATNLRAATGPLGNLDATGVQTMRDAGMGGSVAENLESKDLTPTQSPQPPDETGKLQLSPMQEGATKPSSFYLKPTFFEDQQMQAASRAGQKDEMMNSFLAGMTPAQRGKALTGVDVTEPTYAEKLRMGQANDMEKLKQEHSNRMAEIDEQAKKALTLGDKQLTQDVLKMWVAEKPDKTLEEADPTVHDRWVKSGAVLLRGLGQSNKDIQAFIDYLDKQSVTDTPAATTGLGNLPAQTGPQKPSGPGVGQSILAAGRGSNRSMEAGGQNMLEWLKGVLPVGSPSGSKPDTTDTKPGFKYDTGCLDKAGKYHSNSADCR